MLEIGSEFGQCDQFTSTKNGTSKTVQALITPLRVKSTFDHDDHKVFDIHMVCNLSDSCFSLVCYYSKTNRDQRRQKIVGG